MASLLEASLQRDINHIRSKVKRMGTLAEGALSASLHALTEKDRQLAYSVILRDRYIDELEQELDRLCQEFLVRHQPVAGHLRFVFAVIKINNELERIGDYAESISRHFMAMSDIKPQQSYDNVFEIANYSIPMLRNAVKSFIEENPELANKTMEMEDKVDNIRWSLTRELRHQYEDGEISLKDFPSLMNIINRFERVADRACNICEDVLYMCTGEYIKHKGKEIFKVLFVDERDSCRGQIAQGIGNSLGVERFKFFSAGISPHPVDPKTVQLMADKGIDISSDTSKHLNQILELENYQIFVSLCKEAEESFPPPPTKMISIHWEIEDPSRLEGSEVEIHAAYDHTYQVLYSHIKDLVEAILWNDIK